MTVWRARDEEAPDSDFVTSSKKQSTDAAEESVLWPVNTICDMTSINVRVKIVLEVDAMSDSLAPSYGTDSPHPHVYRRTVTVTRPRSVCSTPPEVFTPKPL